MPDNGNGWNEYEKHVLNELKRLNDGQDSIKNEIHGIKTDIGKLSVMENQIAEVGRWKEHLSEVVSPTQLKELVEKVNRLQEFKTKAMTMFLVAQTLIGLLVVLF